MKILLISATKIEIEGVLLTLENLKCSHRNFFRGFAGETLIDILVTGVGAVETAVKLTERLNCSHYDLVINAGICGSFRKEYFPGSLISIDRDGWGDLGAEDHEEFLDIFDLGLVKTDDNPFTGRELVNPGNRYSSCFSGIPKVKGITVCKSHGKKESIDQLIYKYNPDVETMESAAVFSVCISREINFQCLRSISNFVEPRNRHSWDINGAINNLTLEISRIIFEI